jgi:hypothetical protein
MHRVLVLVREPEGKGPFARHKLRWEKNIRIDVKEIELEAVD